MVSAHQLGSDLHSTTMQYTGSQLPTDPYSQEYNDPAPPPPGVPPADRDPPARGRSRSRSPPRENGYRSPFRRRSPPPRRPAHAPIVSIYHCLPFQSTYLFHLLSASLQAPNPSNVLGVFGLSIRTQERDLDDEFSRFGRVEKVTIVYDQRVSLPPHPPTPQKSSRPFNPCTV